MELDRFLNASTLVFSKFETNWENFGWKWFGYKFEGRRMFCIEFTGFLPKDFKVAACVTQFLMQSRAQFLIIIVSGCLWSLLIFLCKLKSRQESGFNNQILEFS